MNSHALLVDFRNTIIRGYAVNSNLSHEGESTGGLYSFVTQLASINAQQPITHLGVYSDSPPYIREQYYPQYKQDRKKSYSNDNEDFYHNLKQNYTATKELLELISTPLVEIPSLEADDLIGLTIEKELNQFKKFTILSNDSDLNQMLFYDKVQIYKNKKFYKKEDLLKEYDIEPEYWSIYTALVGSHNGVPGIKGIGPKKAIKIIKNNNLLDNIFKLHKDYFETYIELAEIPFHAIDSNVLELPPPVRLKVNYRIIAAFLASKGIQLTERMRELFE